MYKYDYSITLNSINLAKFIYECDEADMPDPVSIGFSKDGLTLIIAFENELSSEQLIILNNLINIHDPATLEELKIQRRKEIDERTTELVADGFEFNGIIFSGSVESQSRIMASILAKDIIEYPIKWMSKDDTTYLLITNVEMLTAFFATGLGTLKYKIDLGSNLKTAIEDATTIEEVNAIIDPR